MSRKIEVDYRFGESIASIASREHEKLNGPYVAFYENGQIGEKGKMKDGYHQGIWKRYHDNGDLKAIVFVNEDHVVASSRICVVNDQYVVKGDMLCLEKYDREKIEKLVKSALEVENAKRRYKKLETLMGRDGLEISKLQKKVKRRQKSISKQEDIKR